MPQLTRPRQLRVRQRLVAEPLADPSTTLVDRLSRLEADGWRGQRVAVALGSRGIAGILPVARTLLEWLHSRGAEPFVIPAMGSHGGATPEGQRELLASYGLTTEALGVPVRAEMETDEVGRTPGGIPVHLSRVAREADAVVLVNRIKPHTDFESLTLGSGLLKMAAIGLGKRDGASACHLGAARLGYEAALTEVAEAVLACTPRLYGVGLLEDGTHQLARLEVLRGHEFARDEPALLQQARAWMPALPFAEVDVLVVDAIGKNISGAGMDPNIIGRGVHGERMALCRSTVRDHLRPRSDAGVARQRHRRRARRRGDITARGRDGPGDHLHQRARRDEDRARAHPVSVRDRRRMPLGRVPPGGRGAERARILRIRDTLALEHVIASEGYSHEIDGRDDLEVLGPLEPWSLEA